MRQIKSGVVVYIKALVANKYIEYTSAKNPVTPEMGASLCKYLKRQGAPGRLVKFDDGEILDEWE